MKKKLTFRIWGILRYVILFLVTFGLWWFFRGYELTIMLVIVIAFVPISIGALYFQRDALLVQASLPALGIGREHSVPVSIRVKNNGRYLGFAADVTYVVRNVFTEYEEKKKERVWAAPGTSIAVEHQLLSHHVGRVEVNLTEFVAWDWLGICSMEIPAHKDAGVVVTPEISPVEEDLTTCVENFPDENETKKHGTDVNPDFEIREYVPGDELKSIHWKLTAKTGRTMVRERLSSGRDKINVLLALTEDPAENDALMSSLHGLGLRLLDKGYPIRLCWMGYGGRLEARYLAEEGELASIIDEILSISGKKNPGQVRNAMETEYPGEAYVVVKHGKFKGEYVR
ncbi:MAG: DUF58 domain-containing protein [Lachnospiraceae bacterium]|nr:DUF58 domain-containing protein [Lachnospiraceae bacterium]